MTIQEIPSTSKEYVRFNVTGRVNGTIVDPSTYTVEAAFKAAGSEPGSGDWKAGSWETSGPPWHGRCLIGPGGTITLAEGYWDVWSRITTPNEVVVRKVGPIKVT